MPRSTGPQRKAPLVSLASNSNPDSTEIGQGRPRRGCTFKVSNEKDDYSDDSAEDVPIKVGRAKSKPAKRSSTPKSKEKTQNGTGNGKSPENDAKTSDEVPDTEIPVTKTPVKVTRKRKIEPPTSPNENESPTAKPKRRATKKSPKNEDYDPVPSTSKGTKSKDPPKIYPNLFSDPDTDDESAEIPSAESSVVKKKSPIKEKKPTATKDTSEPATSEPTPTGLKSQPSKTTESNNFVELVLPVSKTPKSKVIPNVNFASSLFNFCSNISNSYDLERRSRSAVVDQVCDVIPPPHNDLGSIS